MNKIDADNSAVLIIDIQEKLVKMLEESDVAKSSVIIAKSSETLNIPVIITEQYPKGLGNTINEIKETLTHAKYIEKNTFSAYLSDELKNHLEKINKKQIIIFGIETHICVLQTALDLLNNGYEVFVVEDCCGSRKNKNKECALKRLLHAGAQIVTTEMVIFEWLKSSKHTSFKEVQAFIK
jgi:nicotinamidase-related amidase